MRHRSLSTEKAYVSWAKRFIFFHGKRHPRDMGELEINAFLTHLAVKGKVSASTQNQALNAFVFLYRHVLEKELGDLDLIRAKRPQRVPVVLTQREVRRVLDELQGIHKLVATLLYGTGMRLNEALRLRVKDVDFERRQRKLHQKDLARGFGRVYLPAALDRKYPRAPAEWGWQ